MIVAVAIVLMMQMTIVQEVDVVSMLNGGMATVNTVNMCVVFVGLAHYFFP